MKGLEKRNLVIKTFLLKMCLSAFPSVVGRIMPPHLAHSDLQNL